MFYLVQQEPGKERVEQLTQDDTECFLYGSSRFLRKGSFPFNPSFYYLFLV